VSNTPKSFLVIQTAFIGDVILATAVVEKLHRVYPNAAIDFLLRKGNESLLTGHPQIREVLVWDKKRGKIKNLFKMTGQVRTNRYEVIVNIHRYASSGLITAFSGASQKIGFKKNPWSFAFTRKIRHDFGSNVHEVDRNQKLIESLTDSIRELPRLYPSVQDFERVKKFQTGNYICVAPTSVWFTKQFPAAQWIDFIRSIANQFEHVYLLGAPTDKSVCDSIQKGVGSDRVVTLAGQLSFLESAALMKEATMNFVNDSAPMHLASAMDAPVTAIYCSTIPAFGFGPLSTKSVIVQTTENLSCRPCGSHGHKACPQGHFKCATTVSTQSLLSVLK
jgi:heptosyltransferase II